MCLDPITAASSALSDSSCPQRGKPTSVRSPAPGTAPGPPPRGAGLRGRAAAALPFLEGAIPINFSGRTGPAAQSRTGFPSPYSASRARPGGSTAQHGTARRRGTAQPQPAAPAPLLLLALPPLRAHGCCAGSGAVPCCASRPWCPAAGTHGSNAALSRRVVAAERTHMPACSPGERELTKSHPPKSGSAIYRVCNILVFFPKNTCSKFNLKAHCALPDDP